MTNRAQRLDLRAGCWRAFLLFSLTLFAVDCAMAASLELGHIRARTRAFVYESTDEEQSLEDSSADLAEDFEEDDFTGEPEEEYELGAVESDPLPEPRQLRRPLRVVRRGVKAGTDLVLFRTVREPKDRFKASGYLAYGPPHGLRFSDTNEASARPQSPALPEFSFSSDEYFPYLVEMPLAEDAMNDPSLLSELTIEMEPHTVVSGKIDTRRIIHEEMVEDYNLEEQRSTVLRPEEVLIFFESDGNVNETNAVIPFSPATPSTQTIRSSATLRKE